MFSIKDKGNTVEVECEDCGQTEEMPKMMLEEIVSEEEMI